MFSVVEASKHKTPPQIQKQFSLLCLFKPKTRESIVYNLSVVLVTKKLLVDILICPCDYRRWGFEKLVYRDMKKGIRRDRKYAVQPRNVYATGVHMSQNLAGKTTHKTEGRIKYFHYHGTISVRREPCRNLINSTEITFEKLPYVMDTTMRDAAGYVKKFELKMIGSRLQRTRQ